MAGPQVEDGFTRIANELFEALLSADLSKREMKIVWYVVRMTYGFRRKLVELRNGDITKATGICKQNIGPTIAALVESNVLVRQGSEIGIQKDYLKWAVEWIGEFSKRELSSSQNENKSSQNENNSVLKTRTLDDPEFSKRELGVLKTRTESSQNENFRDGNPADDEASQVAKERKKEKERISQTDQIVAPASQTNFLTDEMLADLKVAINGIPIGTVTPQSLPGRLRVVLAGKLSSAPDEVARVFDQMPLATQIAWYCKAIAKAKAAGAHHGGIMRYAATVIANTLIEGGDLLWDEPLKRATPSGPAPVPVAKPAPRGKYADRPWWIPAYEEIFKNTEDYWAVRSAADRAQKLHGADIDPKAMPAMFEAEGLDATMNFIEAARQAAQRARAG